MARNRIVDADAGPESAVAKEAGGAPGVPALSAPEAPLALAGIPHKPSKRYRVVNGGVVMYNNCRTNIRAGKELSEAEYDIALLRRQGIRLEELDPEAAGARQTALG
jgi:hypothetical protein